MVLLPTMQMESMGERMMISFFQAMVIFAHRPWKVRDPKARDAMGVGAFNLVRRDAYEKIGTYQSMRLSVVDDMRLAEKVKQAGLASRVAFGEGMVTRALGGGSRRRGAQPDQELLCPSALQPRRSPCWPRWGCCGCTWGPGWERRFATGWARAGYAVALGSLLAVYVGMGKRTEDQHRLCAAASGGQPADGVYHPALHGADPGARRSGVARDVLSAGGAEEELLKGWTGARRRIAWLAGAPSTRRGRACRRAGRLCRRAAAERRQIPAAASSAAT